MVTLLCRLGVHSQKLPFAESKFRLNLPFMQADGDIDQSHGYMKPQIVIPTIWRLGKALPLCKRIR